MTRSLAVGAKAYVGGRWRTVLPSLTEPGPPVPTRDYYALLERAASYCDHYLNGQISDGVDPRLLIVVRQLLLNYYYYYEVLPLDGFSTSPPAVLIYPRIAKYSRPHSTKLSLPTRHSIATFPARLLYGQVNHWLHRSDRQTTDVLAFAATPFKRRILNAILDKMPGIRSQAVLGEVWSLDLTSTASSLPEGVKRELKIVTEVLSAGHAAILNYRAANLVQLIRRYQPKLLVTFEENNVNGALHAYLGRRLGIPVVAIAHAYSAGHARRDSPFDYNLVFGQSSIDNITSMNGLIDGQVLALGSPLHDEVAGRPVLEPSGAERDSILLISNCPLPGREAAWREEFRQVRNVIERLPKKHFVFKPHYSEDVAVAKRILGSLTNVSFAARDARLDVCVDKTAAAVMLHYPFSNAGFEVMLRERPLGIFNKDSWADSFGFVSRGIPQAIDEEGLVSLIASLDQPASTSLSPLRDRTFANLGCASKAIADFLIELVRSQEMSRSPHA